MKNIIFLDFETSGLFPNMHAPLTLSVALNDQPVVTFKMAPHAGSIVDAQALNANGLTLDEIKQFPNANETYWQFVEWLKKHGITRSNRAIFVAYNASFDEGFMRAYMKRNMDQHRFTNTFYWPVVCAGQMCLLHHADAGLPNFKLGTVYEHVFGRPLEKAHTSAADVEAVRQLFNKHKPVKLHA